MTLIRTWQQYALFDSLRSQPFRWFWLGRLASSATMQMNGVVQGWLVYQLTGSAFALGWVSAGWSIATSVLSLYGGVLSDRMEKRRLLIWMRGAMVLSCLVTAVLVVSGFVQVWYLAAFSLIRGILAAFVMPAQNALLAELVDRKTLLNAVSLNSIGMGLSGIFAASLAGLIIQFFGAGGVYLTMALFYMLATFAMIRLPRSPHREPIAYSAWFDLRRGLAYLKQCPLLWILLALVFVRGLLAMPYRTFLPKYAEDVMGLGATGLGILTGAPGVGSMISALVLASLGDHRGKGKIMLGGGIVLGLSLVLFASQRVFPVALVLLAVVGAASNACMVTNQTLIQANCEGQYRGRIMSMYMIAFGLTQLGTIPAGAIADRLGVSAVIALLGGLFAVVSLSVLLFQPKIRRLE